MMNFIISNIKLSLLFRSVCTNNHFIQKAEYRSVKCVMRGNFLVIKDIFPITIFKKVCGNYHINVTGIRSLIGIEEAVSWLVDTYCDVESFMLIRKVIDNLTATYNIGCKIQLNEAVKLFSEGRYNIERFLGACVKYNNATIIIFASGKVNILGKNSPLEIKEICQMLHSKLGPVLGN